MQNGIDFLFAEDKVYHILYSNVALYERVVWLVGDGHDVFDGSAIVEFVIVIDVVLGIKQNEFTDDIRCTVAIEIK